jgi:hypothetical protein
MVRFMEDEDWSLFGVVETHVVMFALGMLCPLHLSRPGDRCTHKEKVCLFRATYAELVLDADSTGVDENHA